MPNFRITAGVYTFEFRCPDRPLILVTLPVVVRAFFFDWGIVMGLFPLLILVMLPGLLNLA